ncbi:hypothetical protein PVK06_007718 [Gossypium arboreum]|uniref:Uncharacterized protein n=1 Tax=Gossypium arboreum TaxID=29729 RepID=A0ABR0QJ19_GOSAR|nr:hypothetical protein PVK06_007718 [Gossypium arboreum]
MGGYAISYRHKHPSGHGYWQELIESIVWAQNKLKFALATQPKALNIVQGHAIGATHYLLGGIAKTWAFFLFEGVYLKNMGNEENMETFSGNLVENKVEGTWETRLSKKIEEKQWNVEYWRGGNRK